MIDIVIGKGMETGTNQETDSVILMVKNLPAMQETQETQVQSLSQEDSLEEEMATHFSILVGKIP